MMFRPNNSLKVIGATLIFFSSIAVKADDSALIPHGPLDDLFLLHDTKTARISSWDQQGGNHDYLLNSPAPGQTVTIAAIPGAGVIRRIYFAFAGADRLRWRKLILRMYWDGQAEPDIEVPLGDFFGAGLGTLRYFRSLVVSVNPSGGRGRF